MARIYTKTGDDGTTGLLHGGRVSKGDPLIEAYGDIDEVVAGLGVARAACTDARLSDLLLGLQRELFVVAADLAANPRQRQRLVPGQSRVNPQMVAALETMIDALVAERPLRPVFVVPGSSAVEAAVDLARAIARRAERHVIAAREAGQVVGDDVVHYLNRLSDLLYLLARQASGAAEEPASHD
jgi:cob(I)alamin adenosyltransferase